MSLQPTTSAQCSFQVYIDESGDEGFVFNPNGGGSSRWFVLSAIITRTSTDLQVVKLLDAVRTAIKHPVGKEVHFRHLSHEKRIPYVTQIAGARLRGISVLVHKPSLSNPDTFREKYRLYRYAVRLLMERVSWFCRDNQNGEGDGTAWITFSDRSAMSYDEIRQYMDRLQGRDDVKICWDVIKSKQICSRKHPELRGLQLVDAVASSFFSGVEANRYGDTEPRYAITLKPVMYCCNGKCWSHGVKLFPTEASGLTGSDRNLKWLQDHYQ